MPPAGLVATSRWLRETFAGLKFEHLEVIAEDERVVVALTMSGTHTGTVHGISPTGKLFSSASFTYSGCVPDKSSSIWLCTMGTRDAGSGADRPRVHARQYDREHYQQLRAFVDAADARRLTHRHHALPLQAPAPEAEGGRARQPGGRHQDQQAAPKASSGTAGRCRPSGQRRPEAGDRHHHSWKQLKLLRVDAEPNDPEATARLDAFLARMTGLAARCRQGRPSARTRRAFCCALL
jgi:hypothetical protein